MNGAGVSHCCGHDIHTVIALYCAKILQAHYLPFTVKGKSGHGAYPHDCINPIAASAYLITQLQTAISRENQAVKPAVLSIGRIHGGNTHNSSPGEVVMLGTLRT